MQHYEEKIDKALQYLKQPSVLSPTGNSPIVYVVYRPEDTFVVRNIVDTFLTPKAKYYGFEPSLISIGRLVNEYIVSHKYRDVWEDPSYGEKEIYDSIKQEISRSCLFEKALMDAQKTLADKGNGLIVLKDVEMLHPFYMMGVIENKIYNQIKMPVLVLYPGEAQGAARSFLNIYQQDGNYRSINF